MKRHIDYIKAEMWQAGAKQGPELAPNALIELGIIEQIAQTHPIDVCSTHTSKKSIIDSIIEIKEKVSISLEKGKLPLTIGGDHSLGLGSVAAAVERYEHLGVIWFDAHGDMNTEETSSTGNIHGMPVAALMGLCQSPLNDIATIKVKPQNIFWIGARSLDPGELALIEKLNLHVYTTEQIKREGMKEIMSDVFLQMDNQSISHLHLSIDVDAMDPIMCPAVSVPEPNGLQQEHYIDFLQAVKAAIPTITSIDFVEYNPLLDDDNKTNGKWCIASIKELIQVIDK